MTLIVEDGTGVDDANSYNDLDALRLYASDRGITLGTDDEIDAQAIFAKDFLESFRAQYQGAKTKAANFLQWPRIGVAIDCVAIGDDVIPVELQSAQSQLVIEQFNGIELTPTQEGNFIIKDKIGGRATIETEFSDRIRTSGQPRMPAVDSLLAPLFSACGQKFALSSLRL